MTLRSLQALDFGRPAVKPTVRTEEEAEEAAAQLLQEEQAAAEAAQQAKQREAAKQRKQVQNVMMAVVIMWCCCEQAACMSPATERTRLPGHCQAAAISCTGCMTGQSSSSQSCGSALQAHQAEASKQDQCTGAIDRACQSKSQNDDKQSGGVPITITVSAASPAEVPATSAAEAAASCGSTPHAIPEQPAAASPAGILARAGLLRLLPSTAPDPAVSSSTAPEVGQPERIPSADGVIRTKASRNSRRAHTKSRRPIAAAQDSGDCIVCWSAAAGIIFQPCGHTCCCVPCAQPFLVDGHPCPMCRGTVAAGIVISDLQSCH